ncbi:anti-sigma regulatory factor [Desulfofundulus thermobenzoicus]|uniref:Anti-sigma regulatory factor n=1 Tax=Desulfofundulus thermobenzoicus TaxID=29376 RepID=A0A6N7IR67_9FIRM|nr:ATP-binding protein [Desulfofundulus thermobenzoicus]MQL52554.1 anti-sigma regulatory factor [Desulfofundulus thermobenzoicus]HHW43151.1 anti-sigma regulatory factor [Desulfotomaculum sp.]
MQLQFDIRGMDFARAGQAAAQIKKVLQQAGMPAGTVRRVIIVAYELELNIVIHACHGTITAHISPEMVKIVARDRGPGIPDIPLAMQEGYSTAPPHIREMGFGAGMGLPNIKKNADHLEIESEVNQGTVVMAMVLNKV